MNQRYFNSQKQKIEALSIIGKLVDTLTKLEQQPLRTVLIDHQHKLLSPLSDPIILNTLSIKISTCLIQYEILLSESESLLFKELFQLI
ncbi:hypothetical protein ATZ33_06375 [Enterococcus silesiacus]|uniref:Uncharacterized protein n=1 Tax=Enterococcus silesiacus TaxID=332949 RepID=A0ABN4J728_9ENTE|nr:hypothetical protein [Enterococcus silesiacus]ALS01005.1 hypothetical protein ATZ33_06375 [Enterococcus silesiacus]